MTATAAANTAHQSSETRTGLSLDVLKEGQAVTSDNQLQLVRPILLNYLDLYGHLIS
jgi:hypothetical protein